MEQRMLNPSDPTLPYNSHKKRTSGRKPTWEMGYKFCDAYRD